ncbi:hypothetical protein [Microbulbifer discodermiae]|uniref:hypothetical protein n=1 Tax=Microbulbifer sp. 2201CG32-9 TaxID=3232309 RepID=UPI00345BD130
MKDWHSLNLISLRNLSQKDQGLDIRLLAHSLSTAQISLYTLIAENLPTRFVCRNIGGSWISIESEIWEKTGPKHGFEAFAIDEFTSKIIAEQILYDLTLSGEKSSLEGSLPCEWIGLYGSKRAVELSAIQEVMFPNKATKYDETMSPYVFPKRTQDPSKGTIIVHRDYLCTLISDLLVIETAWEKLSTLKSTTTANEGKGQNTTPGFEAGMAPHWGEGLRTIINLANRLWGPNSVNPNDEATFPVNTHVIAELEERGFNHRIAKELAKVIRPEWGKVISKKKPIKQ